MNKKKIANRKPKDLPLQETLTKSAMNEKKGGNLAKEIGIPNNIPQAFVVEKR